MHADTDTQLMSRLARGFGVSLTGFRSFVRKMSQTSGSVHVPAPGAEQRLRKATGQEDPNPPLNNLEVEIAQTALEPPQEARPEASGPEEEDEDFGGRDQDAVEKAFWESDDETAPKPRGAHGGGTRGNVDKAANPLRRVATVAVRHGDHLLMGKRRDNDLHTVPGGHLDDGETFAAGALREVEEETGIKLEAADLTPLTDVHKVSDSLHVQAFEAQLGERPATTMKEDPDGEVYRWHWVDVSEGLPEEIAGNLHVPLERNVLMDALGLVPESDEDEDPAVLMLDLGSGTEREDGHVGIDLYPYDEDTMVHDLNLGIPFEDQSAVHVHMRNAFHDMDLDDRDALLEEICRVLCDGGVFTYEGPAELGMPEGMSETEHQEGVAKSDPPSPVWHKQVFVRQVGPDPAHADDAGWPEPFGAQDGLSAAANAADSYAAETVAKGGPGSGPHPGGGKKGPKDPREMTVGELKKEHEKLSEKSSKLNDQLIEAGHGNVTSNEMYNQAHENPLFAQYKALADRHMALRAEAEHRGGPGFRISQLSSIHNNSRVKKSSLDAFEKVVPFAKKSKTQQIIYCVVLSPEESDEQEDYMTAEDIETVAHRYLVESRVVGSEHVKAIKADVVESFIMPVDMTWDGQNGPQKVKKGAWVIGIKIYDKGQWQKVEDGDYTGVSLSGTGEREDMVA